MDTPRSRWYRPRRRPRSMAVSSKAATAAEKRRSAKASALPSPTAAAGAADPEASGVSVLPMASPASCRSLCVGVGHLAEAVVAVAPGVLRQVLLVVVLGVVEVPVAGLRQRLDLGRDGAVAGGAQALLVRLARGRGGLGLLRGGGVDQRAVLRPAVVALTHALRGVVLLPERHEQLLERHHIGVVDHLHDLGVTRAFAAHLVVGGVGGVPAGVTGSGGVNTGDHPEDALGAPEAAHPEDRHLGPLRKGWGERGAVDVVRPNLQRLVPAGQGLLRRRGRGNTRADTVVGRTDATPPK